MRTEIDLNESEIDLNNCEHFLKANWDRFYREWSSKLFTIFILEDEFYCIKDKIKIAWGYLSCSPQVSNISRKASSTTKAVMSLYVPPRGAIARDLV